MSENKGAVGSAAGASSSGPGGDTEEETIATDLVVTKFKMGAEIVNG